MAGSTYSTNLKIELMTTGENSGTWGDVTNTNLGTALEQAVVGYGNPDYASDANLTISITNSNAAQAARALVLNVTSTFGSLTATRELVVPTIQKQYIVQNNTTGGQSITVKTSAGTGITVPNGRKAHLYVNGTDVIQMFDFVDINGGTIDGTAIGGSSASTGAFTTLNASGATTLDGNVTLGNASGDNVTVTGTITSNLLFTDNTYDIGASGATRPRNLFLAGAATIGGNLSVGGTLTLTGGVNLNGNVTVGDNATDTLTINSTITSNLIFTDNTYDIGASGATRPRNLFLAGSATIGGNQTLTGSLTVDSTTDSSSTITGSIQTDGGLGVAKALYVGTNVNIGGLTASKGVFTDGSKNLTSTGTLGTDQGGTGLTSFTANGVVYASSTSALTTGSALTFDGTNLGVGGIYSGYGANYPTIQAKGTYGGIFRSSDGTGTTVSLFYSSSGNYLTLGTETNYPIQFIVNNSEAMRLTSTGLKSSIAGTNADPVFSYTSDTNTGIFFPAADKLGFTAGGGSDQMVLTTTGLGIGTSSPAAYAKLAVTGTAGAQTGANQQVVINAPTTTAGQGAGIRFNAASGAQEAVGVIGVVNEASGVSGAMTFHVYNAGANIPEYMRISSAGNVGIGTDSPQGKVESKTATMSPAVAAYSQKAFVANIPYATSNITSSLLAGYDSAIFGVNVGYSYDGAGYYLAFATNNTTSGTPTERARISSDGTFRVKGAGTAGSTDAVQFAGSAPASALTLDASGNLGIGETSPVARLHVKTSANNATGTGRIVNTSNGSSAYSGFYIGNDASETDALVLLNSSTNTAYGGARSLLIGTNSSAPTVFITSGTERARITSDGGLWVGNTTRQSTSNHSFIQITESDWTANFQCNTATAANNLGILIYYAGSAPNGTANPFWRAQDNAATRAEIRSNGGLANYSGNDVNLSDRREKTNFAPAKSYLDTICAIPVQTFNYIDQSEDDPGLTLGVVAQDVQAVAPELVMESNWGTEDNPKMRLSIYQTDLQYALMKCIQEQQAIIEQLKARLDAANL